MRVYKYKNKSLIQTKKNYKKLRKKKRQKKGGKTYKDDKEK